VARVLQRLHVVIVRRQEAVKSVADDLSLLVGAGGVKGVHFPLNTVRYHVTEGLEERVVSEEHGQLGARVDKRRHLVHRLVLASLNLAHVEHQLHVRHFRNIAGPHVLPVAAAAVDA